MEIRICLLILLTIYSSSSVLAQKPAPSNGESSELSILKPGRAYVVRFSSGRELFQHTETGMTDTYSLSPNAEKQNVEQRPYTMRVQLSIFRLVDLGSGSWVLMEHPTLSEDYARWSGKHRAMTILSSSESPDPGGDSDVQDRLKKLREAAALDIPTTKTWINLDHAVTITEVSRSSLGIE